MLAIDLDTVPKTSDPDHKDVKTCLFIYSMESFLYKRINQISREKDISSIETLGPFAVVLGRIIEQAQRNRIDKINGPFEVYRGIALPRHTLESWKQLKKINLDGFSSTSRNIEAATSFAVRAETDELDPVLLVINLENETGKYYFSLDTKEYT